MRLEPEWPDRLLPLLLDCFPGAERVVITLVDDAGEPSEHWARVRSECDDLKRPAISRDLIRKVLDSGEPLLSLDAIADDRLGTRALFGELPIRSVLYAPLFDREGRPIGVVQVDSAQNDKVFTPSDLEFLDSFAAFAETVIVTLDSQTGAEDDLASRLDNTCVPRESPEIDGFRLSTWLSPCGKTFGNLLDFIPLPVERLAVVIADFVGFGIVAATKKISLRAEVRFCLQQESDLGKAIELLNDRLCRKNLDGFTTLLLVVMTPDSGDVSVVNAGHQEPIVYRANGDSKEDLSLADDSGLPIEIDECMDYTETKLHLQNGDTIAVFTSGVPESEDPQKNELGVERIRRLLATSGDADVIRDRIANAVLDHIGSAQQHDDITLVVIQRTPDS